jgi:hypothetical protein
LSFVGTTHPRSATTASQGASSHIFAEALLDEDTYFGTLLPTPLRDLLGAEAVVPEEDRRLKRSRNPGSGHLPRQHALDHTSVHAEVAGDIFHFDAWRIRYLSAPIPHRLFRPDSQLFDDIFAS